ncbi:hypothetical protein LVY74_17620, partial [Acinetobacter sp. ME22]|nr:hypothetical protein [Acinetobacter sp. ME22]
EDFKTVGYVKNVGNYNECGLLGRFVKNNLGDVELTNSLRDTNGQFIPFTTTVYNMEVAENHTYFVNYAKLWVHNTNCENKITKALTGKETVDILLEYQDVLREAATGQVTKSVYMP